MKLLIFVRHGDYDEVGTDARAGNLNEAGEDAVKSLAMTLKARIGDVDAPVILTSPVPRSKETAEIIGLRFQVIPQESELLYSDGEPTPVDEIIGLIETYEAEPAVVVVSHYVICRDVPAAIGEHAPFPMPIPQAGLARGRALVIDFERRTSYIVDP